MPKRFNLIGQTFGRLTVAAKGQIIGSVQTWVCDCVCGGSKIVSTSEIRRGNVASCGCLRVGNPTHGHAGRSASPTYRSWRAMLNRCGNPNSVDYPRYGGAGIAVCERWSSFESFLADMGDRPEGKTLDRHPDKNGNYEPGNCRWATPYEQVHNRNKYQRRWWKKPAEIDASHVEAQS
ncbi:hypothetical protein [Methylobacterium planeticum]|uniref:Uncharacterized protein n=1 Tax=Methylobacterium planeticum TaxID=2615211 RepID=A0A6N6MIK3_9HYPH|nr:hypothetical protein [Methylobacterium planeticum]KAB1068887.1 hypothetical protein F6X51_26145 [Methylobacterium planeticum]